jgi:paraquat-inducible protein B
MAARALYARVGLLILVGLLLAVGFVLFLTAGRLSSTAQVMETYVSESVQGLDVGAPVRYRGVQVGRVTELGLVSSAYRRPNNVPFGVSFQLVLVRFAIDLSQVGNESVPGIEEAVRLGLRARITAQGITGVNYVELDFLNPERFPALRIPWQPQYPYVPAAPSTVAQVRNAAEDLVGRLAQLPLDSILTDLAGIVSNLNGAAGRVGQ